MPMGRSGATQWPTAGERRTVCAVQYATPVTDSMGGRTEPTWTDFGEPWWAKATVVPVIVNETSSTLLYQLEGPYRADMMTFDVTGVGLRIVTAIRGVTLTLKVFQLENPGLLNRTLVAHCANAVTQ